MKYVLYLAIVVFAYSATFGNTKDEDRAEIEKIVKTVMDMCYNTGDFAEFDNYIHDDYILWIKDEKNNGIIKWTKEDHRARLQEHLDNGRYPHVSGFPVHVKFKSIEVEGHAAMVIQDFYKGKVQTCYDHIALYKFDSGWKIISWTFFTDPDVDYKNQ